jgi:hypothetical protein
MNRLVFFAVLLFQGTFVLCQTMATPPESSEASGKLSTTQGSFDLSNGQPWQTAARPAFKSFDCHGSNASQNRAGTPTDLDHLFNASCTDMESHPALFALNENSFSPSLLVVRPHPKGEPIPKQWPNLKFQQIPTQWPNLKLEPIEGGFSGLVPAHGSAK